MKEITILNRVVSWGTTYLTYEADQRHAEILIAQLGEQCNSVVTPGTKEIEDIQDYYLDNQESSLYRMCAARANFMSQDRPELQY